MLEQIIGNDSLKIIKKVLLSEIIKLKKKEKSLVPSGRNYHTNLRDYEKAYNQVLDAMDFYEIIK